MGFFTGKPRREVADSLRNILFADKAMDDFMTQATQREPWSLFEKARTALRSGDRAGAIETLAALGKAHEIETIFRLQAWHFLRELDSSASVGIDPGTAFAVLVEVGLNQGSDLLAAYDDRTARYYNYSGAGIVWLRPDASLDAVIDELLLRARAILPRMGPWKGLRPPVPPAGRVRLNILTPAGLHFGDGPTHVIERDPLAGPVFAAGTGLMAKLISLRAQP